LGIAIALPPTVAGPLALLVGEGSRAGEIAGGTRFRGGPEIGDTPRQRRSEGEHGGG
jgi:hypothetical protein